MYYKYFSLSGPPFAAAGSPATLFLGAGHREALAALQWGLREPSGFTMLVGEIGTGKTTLVHSLLANGCDGIRIAFVTNPTLTFEEILRLIAAQLGYTPERIGKLELLQALDSFLRSLKPHESVALIFDEAQDLSDQTLEELRLLSNAQGPVQKRLQMVLVGQLELARRLERPELRQLNQRIGARALLPTLGRAEIAAYVDYRLRAHGGDLRRLFSRRATAELARLSGGIPRRINMLCHNALMLAYAQQARRVEASQVREAARDYDHLLEGFPHSSGRPERRGRGVLIKTAAALSIAIAALGLFHRFASGALNKIEASARRPKAATRSLPVRHQKAPEAGLEVSHSAQGATSGPQCSTIDGDRAATPAAPLSASPRQDPAVRSRPAAAAPARNPQPANAADGSGGDAQVAPAVAVSVAAAVPTPPALSAQNTVVVRSGDTLSKIALRRFANAAPDKLQRQVAMLIKSNPEILDADRIYPGQIIRLQEASKLNLGDVSK